MFNNIKNILIENNYSLKNISTFKIGGNAKYFVECYSIKSIKQVVIRCIKTNMKYKLVGGCSNLLFDDNGYNGAIIRFSKDSVKKKKTNLLAYAGIDMSCLINFCTTYNLTGIENFIGIPCKLGGAIKNNLGAFNLEIGSILKYVTFLRFNKTKTKLMKIRKKIKQNDFSYRKSNFLKEDDIIISAELKLKHLDKNQIVENLKYYYNKKSSSQPLNYASCGSVFKRENDIIPAKIIDDLGLKGVRIGDAEISNKHAGFIVNLNNASSKNVLELINLIKKEVKEKQDIDLNCEIEYVNF